MITGARAIVECLKNEGVNTVFGYPGAAIAPFYEALPRSGIRHILTRGEQAAGHAASGYARVSGRPGVCAATSGPGATNLFTAIATAYGDSIPLIAITGQVSTSSLGRDVFQEVDTTGAAEPFTKYTYLVSSAKDIPRVFKEAFYIASTGRQGPVLIDIPVDIQRQKLDFAYPESVCIRGYKPVPDECHLQVKKLAAALRMSKRPLVCAGGGVISSGAQELLLRLCGEACVPAISTMMGLGALDPGYSLYYGMPGTAGNGVANAALEESDLILIIGARVGDRAIKSPSSLESHAVVAHIDIDSAEIGKNVGTSIPIEGDASKVLERLLEEDIGNDGRSEWIERLDSLRNAALNTISGSAKKSFADPRTLVRELCSRLGKGDVYVSDVGMNQIWSARHFYGEARFLTTGGMGTMGYAIPAALGAKLANAQANGVAVCGDGAFQMSLPELATAKQHGIPLKAVIMRNGILGMVRETLSGRAGTEIAVSLDGSPDFELIARAYGFAYSRADSEISVVRAVGEMMSSAGPYILECVIDPEEAL